MYSVSFILTKIYRFSENAFMLKLSFTRVRNRRKNDRIMGGQLHSANRALKESRNVGSLIVLYLV